MYELPNVQNDDKGKDNSIADDFSRQKNIPEYHFLEARQMRILKELKELKQHVEYLCIAVRLSNTIKLPLINLPFTCIDIRTVKKSVYAEIILHASPTYPPYSILALQRIWKDTKFNIDACWHSSAIHTKINIFEKQLLKKIKSKTIHNVDLKLIWKDVPELQFITKVYSYPLKGEANFLRFLTRIIKNYNYENSKSLVDVTSIDNILDLCLQLSYEDPKNINAIIAKFSSYFDQNPWLLNFSNPSIVDIAAWSAIKQKSLDKIPPELKNWFDLCEGTFLSF